jgi:hypothetical protein
MSSALITSRATYSTLPKLVGEAEFDALGAGPHEAAEQFGRFLQALAAALAHHVDELLVDVVEQQLRVLLVLGVLRREGIEEALVLAGRQQAPLDAELVHGCR